MADIRVKIRNQPGTGAYTNAMGNYQGEQILAGGLPYYTDWTRKGSGPFATMSTTAFAAVVARPTTNAAVEIRNNNTGGGPSLVIDRIFCEWRIATAAASSAVMYAMVGPQAAITAGAFSVFSGSGKPYNGLVTTAVNQTVVDVGWFPWGNSITAALAAATPNGGQDSRVEGRIIVPPQHALCLHVVASLVGDTFIQGASWYEAQLELE